MDNYSKHIAILGGGIAGLSLGCTLLKEGIPEDLAKDEFVRKVYLGKNFEFKRKKI